MDAIVRNAKVNNRRRQQNKRGLSYFKSASHVSSSVQSDLPSVITFRGRTAAGRALTGCRWSLNRVTAPQRRGPCHSWQYAGVLLTLFGNGVVLAWWLAHNYVLIWASFSRGATVRLPVHEQLAEMEARVNRFSEMKCWFSARGKLLEKQKTPILTVWLWVALSASLTFTLLHVIYSTTSPVKLNPSAGGY